MGCAKNRLKLVAYFPLIVLSIDQNEILKPNRVLFLTVFLSIIFVLTFSTKKE